MLPLLVGHVLIDAGGRAVRISRREANVLVVVLADQSASAAPTVAMLQAKLREVVSSEHDTAQITLSRDETAAALDALARLGDEVGLSAGLEELRQLLDCQTRR